MTAIAKSSTLRQIPPGIWALGFVSMLADISSEIIHSLLPVFLVSVLGASALTVGLIEGVAEATAMIVKIFSGTLSDYLGRRKLLAVIGYGMSALIKPLFAVASSMGVVLTARVLDRVGKGIRGAPRDALVADIAPAHVRGAAYGLRQSLDTVGAFVGPLLAVGLMLAWADDFRAVFWVAVIPGVLAVAVLLFGVREPERKPGSRGINPIRWSKSQETGQFLLVGGRGGNHFHSRPIQRGISGAARSAGRHAHGMGAVGDGGDERRLCGLGLSVRKALRRDEPHQIARARTGRADCRRFGSGAKQSVGSDAARRRALGLAHGDDTGLAGYDGSR